MGLMVRLRSRSCWIGSWVIFLFVACRVVSAAPFNPIPRPLPRGLQWEGETLTYEGDGLPSRLLFPLYIVLKSKSNRGERGPSPSPKPRVA